MAAPLDLGRHKCSFSNFSSIPCGNHKLYPKENSLIRIGQCLRGISSHIRNYKLSSDVTSEAQLICARIGLFSGFQEGWTVCPQHRYNLGIHWRPTSTKCAYPYHAGGSRSSRTVGLKMSRTLLKTTGHLVPIGSGICPQCVSLWSKLKDDDEENGPKFPENVQVTDVFPSCSTDHIETYSQESSVTEEQSQTSSQISNWSTEDAIPKERLNQFISYLSNGNISPLKTQCTKPFDECTDKTKNYYKRKAEEILHLVAEGIAPGQGNLLAEEIQSKEDKEIDQTDIENTVVQLYEEASNSLVKTQLLSIIAKKYTKSYLLKKYPNLTKFAIDKARKYTSIGDLVESESSQFRQKMSPQQMEHALDFFSNPTFNQVLAFGTKCLKLENGQKLDIPAVVRTSLHSNMIRMYEKYCEETEFQPLSKSTLYNILNVCSASKQKSLKGLDSIAADGAYGFESLENIVESCEKTTEWKKEMKLSLGQSKTYLKSEFKMHVNCNSECADHCLTWALSDQKGNFHGICQHEHQLVCSHCQLMRDTLEQIGSAVQQRTDKKEEMELDFKQAVDNIRDWKAHIVRTIAQDKGRQELLERMQPNQVLIILDWAMKFLPMLFREKQKDWFGQKGRHWHVTVVIHKEKSGNFKHRTFAHAMDTVKQDYYAVASVLEHVLVTLKAQLPEVDEAFLRSDNAACYHSGFLWSILPGISSRTGVKIKRYDYSEAQSGKSYCDAKIAHMRRKMRMFVAERNNITTAVEMKRALDSKDGVAGCQIAVVDVDTEKQNKFSHKFQKVTQMNNLEYRDNGDICFWKSYNVGPGEVIDKEKYNRPGNELQGDTGLTVVCDFSMPTKIEGVIKFEEEKNEVLDRANAMENEEECVDVSSIQEGQQYLFPCPEPTCSKIYVSSNGLENHLFIGKHISKSCNESSYDVIKKKWAEKCHHLSDSLHMNLKEDSFAASEKFRPESMGWAQKRDMKTNKFTPNVKNYLKEIFGEGQKTGKKASPNEVSKNMRCAVKEDGTLRFSTGEWLQPTQIASFFSRLSLIFRTGKSTSCKPTEAIIDDEEMENILQAIQYSELREDLYSLI